MTAMQPPGSMLTRPMSPSAARRIATLEAWLANQVSWREQMVTLPRSGRQYAIRLPTEADRALLFAEAKRDPRGTLPHWTNIWASGIALADLLLERADELRGRRVLELGSGLGVTATAAMEAGVDLVAVDYSPLALAFCRVNALANAGRGPRVACADWRAPYHPALDRLEASGGFPVIVAGDVLYESRDIAPLIALIDRLLEPDGALWLAEPGRRTAERFLYMLAADGWQCVSAISDGPWPDGNASRVHLHVLHRPERSDLFRTLLGGWR